MSDQQKQTVVTSDQINSAVNPDQPNQTINVVVNGGSSSSSAIGITSFVMGIISVFFLSIVFVPLALIFGVIGITKGQTLWSLLGIVFGIIGFFTSPILLGLLGLASLGAMQ